MRNISIAFVSILSLGISFQSSLAEPGSPAKLPTTDIFEVPNLGTFYLPYENDLIQKKLRKGGIWEAHNTPIFEAFIKPGKDVVDVGAYIGSHTIKYGQLAKPGKVYAFEPQDDIHQILSYNIELNGLGDTVTAYKMALGDRSCNTRMARPATKKSLESPEKFGNRGASPVVGCLDDSDEAFSFEMRTLDSFELDNVGFIKIDVEGAQLMVLKGAEETIKRNKPIMLIEINAGLTKDFTHHKATPREEVIQWLEERGYAVLKWRGSDFLVVPLP